MIPSRRNSSTSGTTPSESLGDAAPANGVQGLVEKYKALPRPAQIALAVGLFGLVYIVFGHNNEPTQQAPKAEVTTNVDALRNGTSADGENAVFTGLETDRPQLMQNWLEQNKREIAALKEEFQKRSEERDVQLQATLQQNTEMQNEMRQMMTDFTSEIRNMQSASERDRQALSQLAEDQRQMQLNAPVDGATAAAGVSVPRTQTRINQTPLGAVNPQAGGQNNQGTARALNVPVSAVDDALEPYNAAPEPLPFMPPIGFIKATMLNGVDALVGGQPTPSLIRLQGTYKTAMNSTVSLDGCYAIVEFQGEISTERAVGKPSRMTCIYPDRGSVTYGLSGYVVDAEDGIIGIPGVFYEGDASRIAAAMMADFAAGLSAAVEDNNDTYTIDQNGNAVKTVSGDQVKNQVAGGINSVTKSLRDYLMERVNRVLPFIRLDATREFHLVLLSGIELRREGNGWSDLFDAGLSEASAANASNGANSQNTDGVVLPPSSVGGN